MNVVFDMDGVIFDTEALCTRSWKLLEEEYRVERIDDMLEACVGCARTYTLDILKNGQRPGFPAEEFLERAEEEIRRLFETEGAPIKKGTENLLSWLKNTGARIALASSTRVKVVERELKQAGLYDYFELIVGGDMVEKSKPEPDIYLCACQKLGEKPENCYAVEDSHNGVRSAGRAGMKVIMVPDILPPTPEMEAIAVQILPDLDAVCSYLKEQKTADC